MHIYISPFWCGVLMTVVTELALLVGYSMWLAWKKKEDKK